MVERARIYRGGVVLTVDASDSHCEALAIRGERILAVGREADVAAAAGADAEIVDLAGRTLVPGFVDAHSHMVFVGEWGLFRVDLTSPPVGSVTCIDDLVRALREKVEATPAEDWLMGAGYDDTLIAEQRHPTRHDLDRVSSEHPIVVFHVSGHLASANTRALEIAGLTRDTPQPAGGVIRRDPETGEPDGVLEEPAAFEPVLRHLPRLSPEQRREGIENGAQQYVARGVTTAQDGVSEPGALEDLRDAARSGALPVRVIAWPSYRAFTRLGVDGIEKLARGPALRMGAVKLFADGSIQGYTGHLCAPYHTPFQGDSAYRGYGVLPPEQLADSVLRVQRAGLQVACHVNGDAAIDEYLDAIEAAASAAPRSDARPVAVHAQMTRDDQLDRMGTLGVVPSFFVLHTYYWGDRHRDLFLGPERARRISPTRSAAERGVRFTIHTDAPVVPMNPLRLIWSAVNRETSGGETLGPEQRLDVREALRATTIDAAWQSFEDAERGSLEPGKLADLAILSGNPHDAPERLCDLEVRETIVGGETVYRASP